MKLKDTEKGSNTAEVEHERMKNNEAWITVCYNSLPEDKDAQLLITTLVMRSYLS
jgi:hypothetical protein